MMNIMSEQTISANLNKLLKLHGDLSLSDLARETHIPQPTLHHILEGKTKKPRRQALEALAKFFAITIPELTGAIPLSPAIPEVIKHSLKISTVPLITWQMAKDWGKDKSDLSKFDEIILDKQVSKNSFALRLDDANMEPLFQEKSILIFDPEKLPKHRDFVLVNLNKLEVVKFNRLFVDGNHRYLKQEKMDGNADLTKIHPTNDRIIGTLIEARMMF